MTPSVRGSLLGLAFIALLAVGFAAGMCWNEYSGTGKSAASCDPKTGQAGRMATCPMMGMDQGAKAASVKNVSGPAAAGRCPMAQMGSGSAAGEGTKQTDAPPPSCCSAMGEKPAAPADPAMKKP